MTTIATDSPGLITELCYLHLRSPDWPVPYSGNVATFTFTPPLTAPEQAIFDRIVNLAKSLVAGISLTEWQVIEPDIAGLVTYQGLANPTLAQTVLAVKAQSRILRALLRN